MGEIDILDSAYRMKRLYQAGARRAADALADELLQQGDVVAYRAWQRIAWTISDLEQSSSRGSNAPTRASPP